MASTHHGLQSLLNEPKRLAAEADRLNMELEYLDKKLAETTGELKNGMVQLTGKCSEFKERIGSVLNSHKRNRKTLQHDMELIDLLEVPQLVDACARNGFFNEAFDLAHFVNILEHRHLLATEVKGSSGPTFSTGGSNVIQSIVDGVHRTLVNLRQQLLQQLVENTVLVNEMEILGTLRKLDSLFIDRHMSLFRHENETMTEAQRSQYRRKFAQNSEIRLEMDFLEARTLWLERNADRALSIKLGQQSTSGFVSIDASDAAASRHSASGAMAMGIHGKISEMLEFRRTHWYQVVSQFNALFCDRTMQAGGEAPSVQLQECSHAILATWCNVQIARLIGELKSLLPQIEDGSSLRSILEQLLYTTARMGTVGCDFTGLVLPLFQDVIQLRFQKELSKAREHFKSMVLTERVNFDFADGEDLSREQLIPLYSPQDSVSGSIIDSISETKKEDSKKEDPLASPLLLMRYPPLAFLLNSVLTCLNFLRECPLVSTRDALLSQLTAHFKEVSVFLVDKAADIRAIGSKYVAESLQRPKSLPSKGKADTNSTEGMELQYAQVLGMELVPHVLVCFESIFHEHIAHYLDRMRSLMAKKALTSKSTTASPLSVYLVSNAVEAIDLLGADMFGQLELCCWSVLLKGELLPKDIQKPKLAQSSPAPQSVLQTASAVTAAAHASLQDEHVTIAETIEPRKEDDEFDRF